MSDIYEQAARLMQEKQYSQLENLLESTISSSEPNPELLSIYVKSTLASNKWAKALVAWELLRQHSVELSNQIKIAKAFVYMPDAIEMPESTSYLLEAEETPSLIEELKIVNRSHFNAIQPSLAKLTRAQLEQRPLSKNLCQIIFLLQLDDWKEHAQRFLTDNLNSYTFEEICVFHNSAKELFGYDVVFECFNQNKRHSTENIFSFLILNDLQQQQLTKHQATALLNQLTQSEDEVKVPFDKAKAASFHLVNKHLSAFNFDNLLSAPSTAQSPKKPRIALCISGQLRGYQQAFQSLKDTLIKDLSPDIFVHTWLDVGGYREPILSHAQRVFPSCFSDAYKNALMATDLNTMKTKYPSLFTKLKDPTQASIDGLCNFYGTEHVVIENDSEPPFSTLNNFQKMYYKMHACHELAMQTSDYDYVIRIRPDRPIHYTAAIDWEQVLSSAKHNHVFLDGGLRLHSTVKMVVGDQFALGSKETMDIYTSSWKTADFFKAQHLPGGLPLRPHSSIAYRLWMSGKSIDRIKNMTFPPLINLTLPAADILKCLQIDSANRMDDVDQLLLSAAQKDLILEK